jgi:hypothetical protein
VRFKSGVKEDFAKLTREVRVRGLQAIAATLTSTTSFNFESESAHMSMMRHSHSLDTRGRS